jgi:hypothetical protein
MDMKRYIEEGTNCLRFRAALVGQEHADVKREFVVQYFLCDNTISIQEPPIRNSGIWGGRFMARKRCRKDDGSLMTGKDLFLGARIKVSSCVFELYDVDEYTLKIMEARPHEFPAANPKNVLGRIGATGSFDPSIVVDATSSSGGIIDAESLERISFDVTPPLSKHEKLTILRKVGGGAPFPAQALIDSIRGSIGVKVVNMVQERLASETSKGLTQVESAFRSTRSRGGLLQELRVCDVNFCGSVSRDDFIGAIARVTRMTRERAGMVCDVVYSEDVDQIVIMDIPQNVAACIGRPVKPF